MGGWKVKEAGEVEEVEEEVEEKQTAQLALVQLCLSGLRSRQTKTGSAGGGGCLQNKTSQPQASLTHSLTHWCSEQLCVAVLAEARTPPVASIQS